MRLLPENNPNQRNKPSKVMPHLTKRKKKNSVVISGVHIMNHSMRFFCHETAACSDNSFQEKKMKYNSLIEKTKQKQMQTNNILVTYRACAKRVNIVSWFHLPLLLLCWEGLQDPVLYLSTAQNQAQRLPVCYVASTSPFLSLDHG